MASPKVKSMVEKKKWNAQSEKWVSFEKAKTHSKLYEETGYRVNAEDLNASDYVKYKKGKVFILPNVPKKTKFQTQTRNEIRVTTCTNTLCWQIGY